MKCVPGNVKFKFPIINNQPSNNHFLDFPFDYKELSIALSNVKNRFLVLIGLVLKLIIAKLSEFVKRTLLDVIMT